ncbi:YciI family protein [Microvirga sp. ACRRW]|uniref:YciI family protein n=1 Tax=Microvirga sp. ACRRW TaxID=2918205 RepID=UPI001EF682B6|nr:YciI family protein [Microvirga sp. ACRRW]MCG7392425.1 YciI family protein [Microvirga sp. ACRRW]
MFIVILTYCKPLSEVDLHVDAHIDWLKQCYDRGVFLLSGRQVPRVGGFILAHGLSRDELDKILAQDPFNRAGVAEYDVKEVMPAMADERLAWLVQR